MLERRMSTQMNFVPFFTTYLIHDVRFEKIQKVHGQIDERTLRNKVVQVGKMSEINKCLRRGSNLSIEFL